MKEKIAAPAPNLLQSSCIYAFLLISLALCLFQIPEIEMFLQQYSQTIKAALVFR